MEIREGPQSPTIIDKETLPPFSAFKVNGIDLPDGLSNDSFSRPNTKHLNTGMGGSYAYYPNQDIAWVHPHAIGVFDGVPLSLGSSWEHWTVAPRTARRAYDELFQREKIRLKGETFDPDILISHMQKDLAEVNARVFAERKGEYEMATTATVMRFLELNMPDGRKRLIGMFAQAGGEDEMFIRTRDGILSLKANDSEGSMALGRNARQGTTATHYFGVIALNEGDRVVVGSDGINDFRGADGDTMEEQWRLSDPNRTSGLEQWYVHHKEKRASMGIETTTPMDDFSIAVMDVPPVHKYEKWPQRYALFKKC